MLPVDAFDAVSAAFGADVVLDVVFGFAREAHVLAGGVFDAEVLQHAIECSHPSASDVWHSHNRSV